MQKMSRKNLSTSDEYLMESEDENIRLDVKTDPLAVRRQAIWCGVKPGMRILDAGCGPGKTTALLHEMIQPGGNIVGIDFSEARILYAQEHYGDKTSIEFYRQDLRESMESLGQFDLVWVRFVLEYYRSGSIDIVKNLINCIKPGGQLCLLDLDYNCLSHYDLPEPMASILPKIMSAADEQYNFDTFVGRKLYSFLYDTGFENIEVEIMAHNLIYGEIKDKDKFNLTKKIEMAAKKVGSLMDTYPGGYDRFYDDFMKYLIDPRRFSYTPLLLCRGTNSLNG
jgi:2-polyprenyl-3-methyl-5-hydroxy-6-metoxy-1,4-benzoquinol methylase